MNYTCILRCRDGSLYTGWTNDPTPLMTPYFDYYLPLIVGCCPDRQTAQELRHGREYGFRISPLRKRKDHYG